MDYLNKIVGTVKEVLPGNPVTREYEVTNRVGSAGPGLVWKMFNGTKKSTKQEACVFVLEKKQLDKYSKTEREAIIENFKRGIVQLTKLRHPRILTVQHALEESRESLAFATEPCMGSLSNVLQNPGYPDAELLPEHKSYELFEVEIKYGLLQIVEALTFLHNDVKMVHRNISPESIVLNANGAWKLAGFDMCINNTSAPGKPPIYQFRELITAEPPLLQPNLNYLAPENVLLLICSPSSDMFSLGALFYCVFNHGKPLFETNQNLNACKKHANELKTNSPSWIGPVPEDAREPVKMLLHFNPDLRPDADQMSKITFFNDFGAKTLQYLDSLFQVDNLQKSQFFKGLPKVMDKLPKRVSLFRIYPCLVKEFVNADMIPFLLPSVVQIIEQSTSEEYTKHILPDLKPVFKYTQPFQIPLILLQNMKLLLSKTTPDDVKNHVLPLVYKSLESDSAQLQELCIAILPSFAHLLDYQAMKHSIVPRLNQVCLKTTLLTVRVNSLLCFGKILEYLDKWLVIDEVFPMLEKIPSREPSVLMAMLGIYKTTLTHPKLGITKDILANKVLPFIFPLSIDNNLNLSQFNAFIATIREMIDQVENEQRKRLEQMTVLREEQKPGDMGKAVEGSNHPPDAMVDQVNRQFGFAEQMTRSPSLPVTVQQTAVTTTSTTGKSGLSLEDKQRLIREQEMQQKLQSQPQIQPQASVKPINPPVKTGPVDLTASLANSMAATSFPSLNPTPRPPLNQQAQPMQPMASLNQFQQTQPMSSFNQFQQTQPMSSLNQFQQTQPMAPLNQFQPMQPRPSLNQLQSSMPAMPTLNQWQPTSPLSIPAPAAGGFQHSKQPIRISAPPSAPAPAPVATNPPGQSKSKASAMEDLKDLLG